MSSQSLAELVAVSSQVAATRSRLEKTGALASLLRRLPPVEISIAVRYLSGDLPQGRIGVGYASVHRAREVPAASEASLTLAEVDGALEGMMAEAIASATGVAASSVRRALMFSGDAGAVAVAASTGGEAALAAFR